MTAPVVHTDRDVLAMLRRHYLPEGRPPGGVFAPEIQSPDGRRRADLIWLPTTIAGGRGLVGHEIKVSRSDVIAELADPTKADPWSRLCDRWWLVVAEPELVEGLDIPEAWGIMAPPSGRRTRSMTVLRPAPQLDPVDRTPGVERLAAWMHYRHHDTEARQQRLLDAAKGDIAVRDAEIRRLKAATVGHRIDPRADRIAAILSIIDATGRHEDLWGTIEPQVIARVILDTEHARHAIDGARRALERLESGLTDPLKLAREHLRRLGAELEAGVR